MVKSLCMALVYCPGLTCIQEGWQYHSLVDFQLGVNGRGLQLPLQPIGRLYWENSGLSEILTQTLGNVNIHGFGGGV